MSDFITKYVSTTSQIELLLRVHQPKTWQVIKDTTRESTLQYLIIMEVETQSQGEQSE